MNQTCDARGITRWMLGALVVALAIGSAACGKGDDKAKPTSGDTVKSDQPTTKPAKDPRRVGIKVTSEGYQPDVVKATPNEEVVLEFTRVDEANCGKFVKVEDGHETELPLNQPVDIPIIMPESGEVTFVCGMGVMKGVVMVIAN